MNEVLEQQHVTGWDPDEILTVEQAARVLKVSYSHMLRLLNGQVPGMARIRCVRAGRSIRVRRGALMEWMREVEDLRAEAEDSAR
jgi:excisionase family DNA binding protein